MEIGHDDDDDDVDDDDDAFWKAVLGRHSAVLRDNFKLSIITGSESL